MGATDQLDAAKLQRVKRARLVARKFGNRSARFELSDAERRLRQLQWVWDRMQLLSAGGDDAQAQRMAVLRNKPASLQDPMAVAFAARVGRVDLECEAEVDQLALDLGNAMREVRAATAAVVVRLSSRRSGRVGSGGALLRPRPGVLASRPPRKWTRCTRTPQGGLEQASQGYGPTSGCATVALRGARARSRGSVVKSSQPSIGKTSGKHPCIFRRERLPDPTTLAALQHDAGACVAGPRAFVQRNGDGWRLAAARRGLQGLAHPQAVRNRGAADLLVPRRLPGVGRGHAQLA